MFSDIFNKLFHTETGKILVSIIWGIGLALLFFYHMCDGPQCIVFKAPNPLDIQHSIFSHKSDCVSFVPEVVDCGKCPVKSNPMSGDNGGKCGGDKLSP